MRLSDFNNYLVLSKYIPNTPSEDWAYKILPENSEELPKAIREGFKVSKLRFEYFKYKNKFTPESIIANQGKLKVINTEVVPKRNYKMKTLEIIRSNVRKSLDKLYLRIDEDKIKLIEETSLDGINVVKVGDPIDSYLGKGTVKRIEKKASSVSYAILLDSYSGTSYKTNSLVWMQGKDLRICSQVS
jgi:hypothetical protein